MRASCTEDLQNTSWSDWSTNNGVGCQHQQFYHNAILKAATLGEQYDVAHMEDP